MKCGFCKVPLDSQVNGQVQLIAANGNGIVAVLCVACILAMGKMLDTLTSGGFAALEQSIDGQPALFVPRNSVKEVTYLRGDEETQGRQGAGI
jgi:hypothetical protein